jgi:hypothetical protein
MTMVFFVLQKCCFDLHVTGRKKAPFDNAPACHCQTPAQKWLFLGAQTIDTPFDNRPTKHQLDSTGAVDSD